MLERCVTVAGERPYQVLLGRGLSSTLADQVAGRRVALLHPAGLTGLAERVAATLDRPVRLALPDGEAAKTPAQLVDCWRRLAQAGLTRQDVVVSLGGGATTDLGGFVAATWLRGVDHIVLPSTVLAMADAAVGGKTGLDLPEGKNLVGAFWEPQVVLCDLDLLASLPLVELRSGLAEIVKAGLIRDPAILTAVEADPDRAQDSASPVLAEILGRAIQVKADVVSTDLREATSTDDWIGREALNLGHTLAHAIERASDFRWRHGQAVSLGLVYAAELSCRLGLLSRAEVERQRALLSSLGLPVTYDEAAWSDLRPIMARDKKTRANGLRLVLLAGPQRPVVRAGLDETDLAQAFARLGGQNPPAPARRTDVHP
ncbi:MAG: 3-dehydroquinate synthase [Propionibacteriaceae bacterium]|jgi:3-dehydroquinate synthase|nr:3-dehydroquinate synthase [Propionibacteriaceae bacterium]